MDTANTAPSSPADAGTTNIQPYRLRWVVAGVVLAANVMDLLDATIVNVAGPSIHRDLGGGATTLQWLSAGYTLAFAVLLIAGARLGDISNAAVSRLGRHLIHIGILLIAAGAAGLALVLMGARTASSWDLVPGLLFIGAGVGASIGQLFQFILTSVNMDEVGSAPGVFEAVQQLSTALGVAVLGTIFFSAFGHHLPPDALQITAWACLAPLAVAFVLVFRLPKHARAGQGH
jgi:MFS family permease